MERAERQRLKDAANEVAALRARASFLTDERQSIQRAADLAARTLVGRYMRLATGGITYWYALPLVPPDSQHVTALARGTSFPLIPPPVQQLIDRLMVDVEHSLRDVKPLFGARRILSGQHQKEVATQAAAYLVGLRDWARGAGLLSEFASIEAAISTSTAVLPASSLIDPAVGFVQRAGAGVELVARSQLDPARSAVVAIDRALESEVRLRAAAASAGNAVRQAESRKLVSEMPVERLKDTTNGQLRINALTSAGINNVQEVLDLDRRIFSLPGIGETTGSRMLGAARSIWQTTIDEMPVRIDIKRRSGSVTALLQTMRTWDNVRSIKNANSALAAVEALRPLIRALDGPTSHVIVRPGSRSVAALHQSISDIVKRAGQLPDDSAAKDDPWGDFLARPSDYYAMLSELGLLADDVENAQGDLPSEIINAIRDLTLETPHLKASLRGYQSFGARFAVVQRKVILGDEMGLGKTVESLAVLAHLRAKGSHHFLVVCPAAVVTNWVREITTKSDLRAHRLHGPRRDNSLTSWVRNGGVAVTTYDSLRWLEGQIPGSAQPACLVFDEAHYIKNTEAQRSRRSSALIRSCDRTILLTGTPLENRTEEFRNLVGYLRPDLAVSATDFAPRQFRKQVAPAYLRRNQEDVLTELPELVEVDEWMPLSTADEQHYVTAVRDGNFMAMRQAAFRALTESRKMQRLHDIVQEAADNERRIVVFSHFRAVLDDIAAILPGRVFGPLTGSVPAAKRQEMVDEFSQAGHGAVLVAQIVAGGVGLNIQAASVVVICEPQLKPTTEWQAIARSRRMGQLESVQVHRLLSEVGVDQRITEILARKSALFAEFARRSETADSAPEAFDISDAEIAREIVASERARLLGREQP